MRLAILLIVALSSLGLNAAALASNQPEAALQADSLVEEALQNNPDLQAAKARWEMASHRVVPARTLDDPTLGLAFSNYPVDSFEADQTPMTGNELRLSQNVPFPGKLAAKGEAAEQQALWFKAVYEDARLQLAQQVRDAYFRLYYQEQAIKINQENLQILENFTSLTKSRYEVGTGLQQDLLKAQVEQSKLLDRLFSLRQQRQSLLAQLNRLLARPANQPLASAGELALTPITVDPGQLKERARQNRPMFASYQSLIDRYDSQRRLAKLDYYPNFNVWASYRFRDDDLPDQGTDFASVGVSINLPIWRERRSEAVAEADSGIRMARRQLEEFHNQVDATIEDVAAQLEKNRNLVQLFDTGIIPQARQSFDASLAAYQVGKIEFLSLLDSLMNLYRYQLDHQRALVDYHRNIARLQAETGTDLAGADPLRNHTTDRMKP